MITALLIDTTGIQDYIFSGNSLAENLGASYIIKGGIKNLLETHIKQGEKDFTNYTIEMKYFGGGNSLVTFTGNQNGSEKQVPLHLVNEFVRNFSLDCLLYFPGLKPAFAIKERYLKGENGFLISHKELHRNLQHNKQQGQLPRVPYKSGATADCPLSGEAASMYNEHEKAYISSVSHFKLAESVKAEVEIREIYKLPDPYQFTKELSKLGQPADAGYIAVVHIDGNGMGELFRNQQSLTDLIKLSGKVDDAIKYAAKELINMVTDTIMPEITGNNDLKFSQSGKNPVCLPIRPIILSGDDITFVCEARLAMRLTAYFIHCFVHSMSKKDTNGLSLDIGACAGIAIVKEKFPFYKAYQEAAELCKQAKHTARQVKTVLDCEVSLLSWNIISRNQEQQAVQPELPDRSGLWQVLPGQAITAPGIHGTVESLISTAKEFEKWPKSQLIRLRNNLYEEDAQSFEALRIKAKEKSWGKGDKKGEEWKSKVFELLNDFSKPTRLLLKDMIEIIDFYPSFKHDTTP